MVKTMVFHGELKTLIRVDMKSFVRTPGTADSVVKDQGRTRSFQDLSIQRKVPSGYLT